MRIASGATKFPAARSRQIPNEIRAVRRGARGRARRRESRAARGRADPRCRQCRVRDLRCGGAAGPRRARPFAGLVRPSRPLARIAARRGGAWAPVASGSKSVARRGRSHVLRARPPPSSISGRTATRGLLLGTRAPSPASRGRRTKSYNPSRSPRGRAASPALSVAGAPTRTIRAARREASRGRACRRERGAARGFASHPAF